MSIDATIAKYHEWVEQGRRVGRRLREMGYPEKGVQYRAGYYPGKDGKR